MVLSLLGGLSTGFSQQANKRNNAANKRVQANKNKAKNTARKPLSGDLPNKGRTPDLLLQIAAVDPYKLPSVLKSATRIDRLVEMQLLRENLEPNLMSSDAQFVRRIHLDVTGTVP